MRLKFLEKRLIRRIQAGNPQAFGGIYDQYIDKIYKFVYFKVKTPEEAEDLVSQVFTKILEYILKGKEIKSIQALIYQVARNQIVDYYRKRTNQTSLEEAYHITESGFEKDFEKDINERMEKKSDLEKIARALRRLKGEAKEALILRYINEYSIREVAGILGKSEGAVRVMIHRAVKDIREEIKKLKS